LNHAERIQYYASRALGRLEEHGFPLRSRSLMIFQRAAATEHRGETSYVRGGITGPVSEDQFRAFRWAANPSVVHEVLERQGAGRRWVIAARRGNEMDGFCWLESQTANMFFFDLQYPIPIGTYYLSQVWVSPEARGEGIGHALIVSAESFAADSGATHIFAGCVPQNGAMRHLFAQLGWRYQQRVDYVRAGPAMRFRFSPEAGPKADVYSVPAASRLFAASARDRETQQPLIDSRAGPAT
jgi:GNAT superfamily N-acetyltransferase